MTSYNAASSSAQNRAWIYIRKTHTPDLYFDSLEEKLRSFAASQSLTVVGISIDFNQRRGGHGVSQMLWAANERAFDILVVNSLDQVSDNLLSAFDLRVCLDNKDIKVCAPGCGFFDFKKVKSNYDIDRFMDELDERRNAREHAECFMGDSEPKDYESDYDSEFDLNGWEKKRSELARYGRR